METSMIFPIILVMGLYGAAAAILTAAVRDTLKRTRPRVEAALWRTGAQRRGIPCLVSFALLTIPGGPWLWSQFGLVIQDGVNLWSVRLILAVFAGIFSNWAYGWWREFWKGRRQAAGSASGAGSETADGTSSESDVL